MNTLTEALTQAAIEAADGNLTLAAVSLGMPRRELWLAIKQWPRIGGYLNDLRESLLDDAEMLLRQAVRANKNWAITFMLKTMGKGRGYAQPTKSPRQRKAKQNNARLNPEQLEHFQRVQSAATGAAEITPEPDFCRTLDTAGVQTALSERPGDLNYAAHKLGVTRAQLVEYLTRRPALLHGDAREEVTDHAESALRAALAEKKAWAIRFTLKTLGRSRGYSEYDDSPGPWDKLPTCPDKSETYPTRTPIGVPDLSRLNDEQLARWERLQEIARGGTPAPGADQPQVAPAITTLPAAPVCSRPAEPRLVSPNPATNEAARCGSPSGPDASMRRPLEAWLSSVGSDEDEEEEQGRIIVEYLRRLAPRGGRGAAAQPRGLGDAGGPGPP